MTLHLNSIKFHIGNNELNQATQGVLEFVQNFFPAKENEAINFRAKFITLQKDMRTYGNTPEILNRQTQLRVQLLEFIDYLEEKSPVSVQPTPSTSSTPISPTSSTANPFQYHVFLSHNSKDKPQVEHLAQKLFAESLTPFLDKWHLIPGQPWQDELEEAIKTSQTTAVFIGPGGYSPWKHKEMRAALSIQAKDTERAVIPVLLPGANQPGDDDLPLFLQQNTWVDFRGGLDDPRAFAYLIAGITCRKPFDVLQERGIKL